MWSVIFPGQGSQHPGMGKFLYENFKTAKHTFEEASDALRIDFKKLCFDGSEEDLKLTKNTQPCLLLVSVAGFRVLNETTNLKPVSAAGHSVGEYAAVVTSGALSFTEGMHAVRTRGEAMQAAVPVGEGAMSAVMGLDDNQVRDLCKWVEKESGIKPLEPANFNSPGQVVISGSAKALDWLDANFKKEVLNPPPARAKFIRLNVSAPFHCSMMKPAEDKMRDVLKKMNFGAAKFPVVQNVEALPVTDGNTLRENLIRQISAPVLWTQCVQKLNQLGAKKLIECGSGKVLAGLVKKIDPEGLVTFNMNSIEELQALEKAIKE